MSQRLRGAESTGIVAARTALAAAMRALNGAAEPSTGLYDVDETALLESSRMHGVDHILLDWFVKVAPDHSAVAPLRSRNLHATAFHLRAMGSAQDDVVALTSHGIQHLAMKGPVLATLSPANCREYSDLDMLVAPENFAATVEALCQSGATLFPQGGWRHFYQNGHAQIPVELPLKVGLDLHWHLCSRPQMRKTWHVDPASELLARSEVVQTSSGPIHALSRNDMLIHTAAHAGWSGGDRLKWFADVDAVVRSSDIDWDVVVRRTKAWGLDAMVGDILRRTQQVAGTPIPADVIASFDGGHLGALFRFTERLQPVTAERNIRSARRLVRLHARSGVTRTIGALGLRSASVAVRKLQGKTTDFETVFEPRGADDENWRGPYLAFVETGTTPKRRITARSIAH